MTVNYEYHILSICLLNSEVHGSGIYVVDSYSNLGRLGELAQVLSQCFRVLGTSRAV